MASDDPVLRGIVEMDETYVGGGPRTWNVGDATDSSSRRAHPSHLTVNHSRREYARTDADSGERVHVNTAQSYHALLRRIVVGVHHWVSGKHLDRYAAQAAHAWNHRRHDANTLISLLARPAEPLPFRVLTA